MTIHLEGKEIKRAQNLATILTLSRMHLRLMSVIPQAETKQRNFPESKMKMNFTYLALCRPM